MELKKLTNSFYNQNIHLKYAMDNYNGKWDKEKVRGYGIVVVQVDNLNFAIPLRSNANKKASYIIKKGKTKKDKSEGLDYSKALLIRSGKKDILDIPFKVSSEKNKKLNGKGKFIRASFEKYVNKYVKAVEKCDQNILNSSSYMYSTLVNYHSELGLDKEPKTEHQEEIISNEKLEIKVEVGSK